MMRALLVKGFIPIMGVRVIEDTESLNNQITDLIPLLSDSFTSSLCAVFVLGTGVITSDLLVNLRHCWACTLCFRFTLGVP